MQAAPSKHIYYFFELMMRSLLTGSFMVLTLVVTPSWATPLGTTLITDNYWGSNDHGFGDVIADTGSLEFFNIDHLKVVFNSDGRVNVTVYTGFLQGDARAEGTQYGDLFIASGGWRPYVGSDPVHLRQDSYATTGTRWNYVIDTSEGGKLYGGNFSVYQSQDLIPSGYIYRDGQIVQRKAGGSLLDVNAITYGAETYAGKSYNTLTYTFNSTLLGLHAGDELAFKWGMTCANDSIEGRALVPLATPAQAPLLALGFGAMIWVKSRHARQRAT